MYGSKRLNDNFEKFCQVGDSPQEIIDKLLATLEGYTVRDDLTLLVLRY